ncbi:MAG TPA: XkdF-like putative serine protease domain-containing protein [Terriglobales bacterium]|nr:XkdF-like putative serine protease domain-containing protein [Terriglobales bacterium]
MVEQLFIPIRKVDAEQRLVYGVLAAETPDLSGEILDYESSKAAFQEWSEGISKVTDGKSKGNLRVMHNPKVAGKFTQLEFNDDAKQVEVVAKIEADDEWKLVETGCYTGFSIGAKAAWRKKDEANPKLVRYAVGKMIEGSIVDLPCIPTATFEYIKAGVPEIRKFTASENSNSSVSKPYEVTVMPDFKTQFKSVLPLLEKIGTADRMVGFTQKTAQSAGIRKSLWDVSDLACCLMTINWIRQNLKFEAEIEGDGSAVPEQLRTWLDEGSEILQALVAEETAELTADAPSQAEGMMTMAAEPEVTKTDVKPEEATNKAAEPEVEKTEQVEAPAQTDVEKSVEALVQKKFNEAVSGLKTEMDEQKAALTSLVDSVKTIADALTVLKATPAPVKGVITVTKAEDNGAPKAEAPKDAASAFKMALAPEKAMPVIG